jgi:hypothetical protein
VDADEVALLVVAVGEGGSGGAVGFVTDDEVDLWQAELLLRPADDIQRVVGGEDDAHVLGVVPLRDLEGEALRIGGGGVAQLVGEGLDDVFVVLSRFLPTSASEQTAKLCSGRPLSCVHSVRDWERRFNEGTRKRTSLFFPAISSAILRRSKGLAGAAGHDELATVGFGRELVLAELLLRLQAGGAAGLYLDQSICEFSRSLRSIL